MDTWFVNAGAMLYFLRVTFPQRAALKTPGQPIPRKRFTQNDLIARLAEVGYAISAGALSEIEAGASLPRDTQRFVEAIALALALEPKDKEQLSRQFAFDIVRQKLGEDGARLAFGGGPQTK